MKKFLSWLGASIVAVVVIGTVVIASGVVPVKASSGHLPITSWLLHFAMQRSVATHSRGIVPPPLDEEALVVRGATQFEAGCVWCHGAPGTSQPRIVMHMTPHPPELSREIGNWDAAELFYIVRHGVKFTGMPGWPSPQREDEVWAIVAFLQRFPEMNFSQYAELSGRTLRDAQREAVRTAAHRGGDRQALTPTIAIERCVACHGADGQGRHVHPKLAGQSARYLVAALKAYREGERHSGVMGPIAAPLSDAQIDELAAYYQELGSFSATVAPAGDQQVLSLGAEIARNGLLKERAGACVECHDHSHGQPNLRYPKLDGQNQGYLIQQLHLFRSGSRGGSDYSHIMENIAESLSDEQIAAVAAYYAHRPTVQTEATSASGR